MYCLLLLVEKRSPDRDFKSEIGDPIRMFQQLQLLVVPTL